MIHTILDTDLYKFTTSYAYIKLFPYAMGTFSCRNFFIFLCILFSPDRQRW